jgi:hypothetical protein
VRKAEVACPSQETLISRRSLFAGYWRGQFYECLPTILVDDGLCGSYSNKSDRNITSGLPTTRKQQQFPLEGARP